MLTTFCFTFLFCLCSLCVLGGPGGLAAGNEDPPAIGSAWRLWCQGRIDEARTAALAVLEKDPSHSEALHLRILTSFATGKFEECAVDFEALDDSYHRYTGLAPVIVDAYLHLNRPADAAALGAKTGQPAGVRKWLDKRSRRPLKVKLDETTVIPFTESQIPLDLMPAVPVEINGLPLIANLDTGGAFLAMAPGMAQRLGIETSIHGEGLANMTRVTYLKGLADELRLGGASLANVPVDVIRFPEDKPLPPGLEDLLVVGTNVLEQFFTTWDNGNKRLVLSPRGRESSRKKHLALVPPDRSEMDFFYLADHHLGALGSINGSDSLFFHVDTGLVLMDGQGRQAALAATAKSIKKWGIPYESGPFIDGTVSIALGPLEESGHIIHAAGMKSISWQGLATEATLSHGFTKNYVWTMDFDNRTWLFTKVE